MSKPVSLTSPIDRPVRVRRALDFAGVLGVDGRTTGCALCVADSFVARGRGLLGHAALRPAQALWITRCPSIHTVGMGYAIDVVFLDATGRILRIAGAVAPLRFRFCRGAVAVVELLAGQAQALGLHVQQRLSADMNFTESSPA